MFVSKLKAACSAVLILSVMATGATFLTSRTAAGQDDKKPSIEKPIEPTSKQQKEQDKEAFTAWGKEVGGLQAGLGFKAGERRAYRHGETVILVVRVRNVGKEAVKLSYFQPGIDRTLKVTDGDGRAIPQPVVIPGDLDYKRKVAELAPGKEIELYELKRLLRAAGEGTGKVLEKKPPYALYGTGKVLIQYDKLVPESTDKVLGIIATGKLELDVKEAERGGKPEAKPADKEQDDVAELHGAWTVVSAEADGEPIPKDSGYPYLGGRVVFDKENGNRTKPNHTHGRFLFRENTAADFRLDPSSTPKVIELHTSVGVTKHIYRLEADRLWLCLQIDGKPTGKASTEFTTKKGDGRLCLVLERQPKTTGDKKSSDKEKPKAKKELAVQGCWTLASREKDGRVVKFKEGEVELAVTYQFCVIKQQGVDRLFTYTLSPDVTPPQLDLDRPDVERREPKAPDGAAPGVEMVLTDDTSKFRCIYEVEGDTLKVCASSRGKRPTEFSTTSELDRVLLVFKRKTK